MRKGGRFGLRIWLIKKIVESLMKSKIDEYDGHHMIAHRTKTTMTMGYAISTDLVNSLSRVHSAITDCETIV